MKASMKSHRERCEELFMCVRPIASEQAEAAM